MIKTYTYKNKKYYSVYRVRQKIWETERIAFGEEPETGKEAFWQALGVTYTEEEEPLQTLINQKLAQLNFAFEQWYNDTATVKSSLGFEADADLRAITDVCGLVKMKKPTTTFMDVENKPHELTADQLQTLENEIYLNGQQSYVQKWVLRDSIMKAKSKDELDKIVIKFTPSDFTKK